MSKATSSCKTASNSAVPASESRSVAENPHKAPHPEMTHNSKVEAWLSSQANQKAENEMADSASLSSSHRSYGRLKLQQSSGVPKSGVIRISAPARGRVRPIREPELTEEKPDSQYLNKDADAFLHIQEYCSQMNLKYPQSIPYHVLQSINLYEMAQLGKKFKATKVESKNGNGENWDNLMKQDYFLYGNEIKRNGNMGTDKGSMSGAVDAKFNFIGTTGQFCPFLHK